MHLDYPQETSVGETTDLSSLMAHPTLGEGSVVFKSERPTRVAQEQKAR